MLSSSESLDSFDEIGSRSGGDESSIVIASTKHDLL